MLMFKFGEPHHGWLPVRIEAANQVYEFEASDVPSDPLERLIDALRAALNGYEREIWWHLEPDGYYLNIASISDEYEVSLYFAENSKISSKIHLFTYQASFSKAILPIWRALRSFYAYDYEEPHWPNEPDVEIRRLTQQIRRHGEV
ncbi:MAG: hypothetical protein AAF485_06840 [Chloroflexota bacterium]